MSEYDSTKDTLEHIGKVRDNIDQIHWNLSKRSFEHDASKLEPPEKEGWDIATPKLKDLVYGSDEYRAALRELRPTVEHHYSVNDHHPEFYPPGIGINGMTLMAVIEMLCDWKAASERTKQVNTFKENLPHNFERFGIESQLAQIITNTVDFLGW